MLDFGPRVHEHMTTANLTMDDVSRETGMSRERIAAIVEGETPLLDEVVLLCAALMMHISIDNGCQIHHSQLRAASATSSGRPTPAVTSLGPPHPNVPST